MGCGWRTWVCAGAGRCAGAGWRALASALACAGARALVCVGARPVRLRGKAAGAAGQGCGTRPRARPGLAASCGQKPARVRSPPWLHGAGVAGAPGGRPQLRAHLWVAVHMAARWLQLARYEAQQRGLACSGTRRQAGVSRLGAGTVCAHPARAPRKADRVCVCMYMLSARCAALCQRSARCPLTDAIGAHNRKPAGQVQTEGWVRAARAGRAGVSGTSQLGPCTACLPACQRPRLRARGQDALSAGRSGGMRARPAPKVQVVEEGGTPGVAKVDVCEAQDGRRHCGGRDRGAGHKRWEVGRGGQRRRMGTAYGAGPARRCTAGAGSPPLPGPWGHAPGLDSPVLRSWAAHQRRGEWGSGRCRLGPHPSPRPPSLQAGKESRCRAEQSAPGRRHDRPAAGVLPRGGANPGLPWLPLRPPRGRGPRLPSPRLCRAAALAVVRCAEPAGVSSTGPLTCQPFERFDARLHQRGAVGIVSKFVDKGLHQGV